MSTKITTIGFSTLLLILILVFAFAYYVGRGKDTNFYVPEEEAFLSIVYGDPNGKITITSYDEVEKLDFSYMVEPLKMAVAQRMLEKTPNLEELYLNNIEFLTNDQCHFLVNLPKLRLLNLSQTRVFEDIVLKINSLENLEILSIGWKTPLPADRDDAVFSDTFLTRLGTPELRDLTIWHPCNITNSGLLELRKFPLLEEAILYSDRITEEGILALAEEIKSAKVLRYDLAGPVWLQFLEADSPEAVSKDFDPKIIKPKLQWGNQKL